MERILNCSNHKMTEEQIEEMRKKGYEFVELDPELKNEWGQMNPQNYEEISKKIIMKIVKEDISAIHLAGFMPAVHYMILATEYLASCYYAYSERVSEEVNGVKTSYFKHKGFYLY